MAKASPDRPVHSPESADSGSPTVGRAASPATASAQHLARKSPRRTRIGEIWVGIIVFALVLVFLLIFILQNTRPVEISYFAARGQLPLAVAMLLSAVGGVLLAAIAGSLRMWQLRRNARQ